MSSSGCKRETATNTLYRKNETLENTTKKLIKCKEIPLLELFEDLINLLILFICHIFMHLDSLLQPNLNRRGRRRSFSSTGCCWPTRIAICQPMREVFTLVTQQDRVSNIATKNSASMGYPERWLGSSVAKLLGGSMIVSKLLKEVTFTCILHTFQVTLRDSYAFLPKSPLVQLPEPNSCNSCYGVFQLNILYVSCAWI